MGSSFECLYRPASLLAPMDELFPKFELDFSLSLTKMPPEAISLESRSKHGWFNAFINELLMIVLPLLNLSS